MKSEKGILFQLTQDLVNAQASQDKLQKELEEMKNRVTASESKLHDVLNEKKAEVYQFNLGISEANEKNTELQSRISHLEQQLKIKDNVLANVTHELRTPLHGIMGMCHLLEKTKLNVNQKEYIEVSKNSAENLLVIINDILNISRLGIGKIELKKEPLNIVKFLNQLESMFRVKTEEKGLQLSFLIPNDLPKFIIADKTRLFQILINLLNNAVKFTDNGFVILSTEFVRKSKNEIDLRFVIKDSGIGMKEEDLCNIFKSYTRVHDEEERKYEGSGLGLSIVKHLTEFHDGSIDVKSKIDKGSTFNVQIPFEVYEEDEIKKEVVEVVEDEISVPNEWKEMNFLMVEDNKANIVYSKDIFQTWGLNLKIVNSIQDANQELIKKYDCIFCDINLPDGNGLELISNFQKDINSPNQKTPIIILTASSYDKDMDQLDQVQIESYLSKPFEPNVLLEKLEQILGVNRPVSDKQPAGNQKVSESAESPDNEDLTQSFMDGLVKRFKGRTTLMAEMVNIFLDQTPVMLETLRGEDLKKIRFEAHKFKSTVNILGLQELRNYANKTEHVFEQEILKEDFQELINDFILQIETDEKIAKDAMELMMQPAEK